MTEVYNQILNSGILLHSRKSVKHYTLQLANLEKETNTLVKGISSVLSSLNNINHLFGEVYETVDSQFQGLSEHLFDERHDRLAKSFDNLKDWGTSIAKTSNEYLIGLETVDKRIKRGIKINQIASIRLEKFKSTQRKVTVAASKEQPVTPRLHNKLSQREFELDQSVKDFLKVQQQLEEDSFDFFQNIDAFNKKSVVQFLEAVKNHYVGDKRSNNMPTPPIKSSLVEYGVALDTNGLTNVVKVSKSLDAVLHDPVALAFFQEYCRKEYCAENLAFYQAVQVFKQSFEKKVLGSGSGTPNRKSKTKTSNSKRGHSPLHPSANNSPDARRKRYRNEDPRTAQDILDTQHPQVSFDELGGSDSNLVRRDSSSSTGAEGYKLLARAGSNPSPFVKLVQKKTDSDEFLKSITSELNTREALKSAALNIFNQFIPNNAPEQINISADIFVVLDVAIKKNHFSVSMFDSAQNAIYELMETDTWRRFGRDPIFNEMVKRLTRRTFNIASKFSMNKEVALVDSSDGEPVTHNHHGRELKKKASQVRLSIGNQFNKFTKPDTPNLNKNARYSLASKGKLKAPGALPIPFSFNSKADSSKTSESESEPDDFGFGDFQTISSSSQLDAFFDSQGEENLDDGTVDSQSDISENEEPAMDLRTLIKQGPPPGLKNGSKKLKQSNSSKRISGMGKGMGMHIPHLKLKSEHSKPRSSLSSSSGRSRRMSLSQRIGNRLSLSKRSNRI